MKVENIFHALVLIFFIIQVGCSNDENEKISPATEIPETNDSIISFIKDSTFSCNSVLYYVPSMVTGFNCPPTPFSNPASTLEIDIDGDSINEFRITCSQSQNIQPFCGSHCSCWNYFITVKGIGQSDSISYITFGYSHPIMKYNTSESILISAHWWNEATIYENSMLQSLTFNDCYMGVKKNNCFGWIHVAPKYGNGVYVKEFAINLTPNRPIKAGQK
jgi:hypothetical protein